MEGSLYGSSISDGFAIGSSEGPVLTAGQIIELLMEDDWIAGQIVNQNSVESKPVNTLESTSSISSHDVTSDRANDSVNEASEKSFPSSDAPAWASRRDDAVELDNSERLSGGYYFKASADSRVHELHEGMKVRTSELSSEA